ncbi:MAG TPA: isoprenylcysteine carboxylmethyltransferase family protein [bacterium]|nr:isoprenylcysteine carboxylmethyltransferase family protein [bacterium]HPN42505.1 isoprenylcysteine carboxylmethyltransferase family protein [bacterium]
MIKIIILICATVFLLVFSRRYLLHPRSYGFYRFFAFELTVIGILLNTGVWFKEPFSPLHLLSWFFLIISIIIVIAGYRLLRKIGKSIDNNFEHTTTLVVQGIYRYIRHPMYSSLLFLALGIFFKQITPVNALVLVLTTAAVYLTARAEERDDLQKFGASYRDYMQKSKMLVPLVF